MIKAVFFDVGNTLLYPHPSVSHVVFEILAEEGHEIALSAIEDLMPLVDEFYEDRYRSDDTFWTNEAETSAVWVGMYSLLCRQLGLHADAERLALRVYDEFGHASRWRVYPDVAPAFDRLVARGLRIGLISNWDRRLSGIIEGLGLSESLSTIVSSADVGLHKPDPRIFELACARLGVSPAHAAHVGDHHYADILGAKAVGMKPVLIDRHSGEEADHWSGGAPMIRCLDGLEAILGLEG